MKTRKAVATLLLVVFSFYEVVLPFAWQQGDKTIIAVVDFKNTSQNTRLNYLEQTIPEAISTTMARSGRLEIVERSRLEAALIEMEMNMLGIVDEETAAVVGRAVGATTIMVGSFVSISGLVRINARLIDVQTARVLKAESVQGPEAGDGLFRLMDQIAEAMERQLTGTPDAVVPPPPKGKKKSRALVWLAVLGAGGAAYYVLTMPEEEPKTASVGITVDIQP